jgi:hypothetical protein
MELTREHLDEWLRRYGEAWEARDADAAAGLFADDGAYHWGPLEPPLRGRDAIRDRWSGVTAEQDEVSFRYELLGIDSARGFARWWSTYVLRATGARHDLDGIFVLDFGANGLCRRLQEWWLARETPPD